MLKRNPLKHNVIDRDKIVVPPNWDSWGKIRVLSGNFDAELISNAWAEDINSSPADLEPPKHDDDDDEDQAEQRGSSRNSAIGRYEEWCRDPNSGGLAVVEKAMHGDTWVTIDSDDTQAFLERQLKILEAFKAKAPDKATESAIRPIKHLEFGDEKTVSEHIGPVQFNMGGIQVDADDMLKRLKVGVLSMGNGNANQTRTAMRTLPRRRKTWKKPIIPPGLWARSSTTTSCRASLVVFW